MGESIGCSHLQAALPSIFSVHPQASEGPPLGLSSLNWPFLTLGSLGTRSSQVSLDYSAHLGDHSPSMGLRRVTQKAGHKPLFVQSIHTQETSSFQNTQLCYLLSISGVIETWSDRDILSYFMLGGMWDPWASPVAQQVKNLPAMQETQETWVRSRDQEDPLEKGMTTHSSCSCLENPMDRGAWWATVHGIAKSQT